MKTCANRRFQLNEQLQNKILWLIRKGDLGPGHKDTDWIPTFSPSFGWYPALRQPSMHLDSRLPVPISRAPLHRLKSGRTLIGRQGASLDLWSSYPNIPQL